MVFFQTIESIFSIVIMIGLGYGLMAKGWVNKETSGSFAKIITNIALPAYMIWNLLSTFNKDSLEHLATGLVIPFVSMALSYAVGYGVSKVLKVAKGRQGIFRSMFFVSNTIFIGLPVNVALFGEGSIPYVLLYYIGNTTFFWTVGVNGIRRDGAETSEGHGLEALKNIISPPFLSFILAIVLVLLDVHLPTFVLDTCKYLGNLTTPLSMLFIGMAIFGVDLKNTRFSSDMLAILAGRFFVSPLITFWVCSLGQIPAIMKDVFIIQASLPAMTMTAIVAKAYHADAEYAAVMTTVTTLLAAVTVPVFRMFM